MTCYKTHKPAHETQSGDANGTSQPSQPKRDRPGTTQRVPKVDFTGFENDKEFQRLLTRYPSLKVQLQTIYGLTLEPGPDEARTWNRQPLPGSNPQPMRKGRDRMRSRGRGDRGHRGGRGGQGGFKEVPEDRQRGPWTQEKGDKEALEVIKRTRKGNDDANEGMREFIELCQIKFANRKEGI